MSKGRLVKVIDRIRWKGPAAGDVGLVVKAYSRKEQILPGKYVIEYLVDVLFGDKIIKNLVSPDNVPPSTVIEWLEEE